MLMAAAAKRKVNMYPKTIKIAAALFVLSIIMAVISTYIDYQHEPEAMSRQILLLMVAIFLAPYCLIFFYIMLRRNWARILWLIVFLLGSALMFYNQHPVHYNHVSLKYFSMFQALLQLLITVLLFLPESGKWFKARDKTE